MGDVVDLLSRPVYGMLQVDRLLCLPIGTSARWIDGYVRAGRTYPPVVREQSTGSELVTWGEFVETRLLSEYRNMGVPLVKMRPAIDRLREELQTPYPLASARAWTEVDGRELVGRVEDEVRTSRKLRLVLRTGQYQVDWSPEALKFKQSIRWENDLPARLIPMDDVPDVVVDPLRGFGEPTVRGVRTEIIAELYRTGETSDAIAELYDMPRLVIDSAVRYELKRAAAA